MTEAPFGNTLDPKFFYRSQEHQEAYHRLMYCIEENKGGAILVGEYGTGKSMISRTLLDNLMISERYIPVFTFYPVRSPKEMLKEIYHQVEKKSIPDGIEEGIDLFKFVADELLFKLHGIGKHLVVIVDEAHLIKNLDVFEELRLLLNFQSENQFLLTVILMGQPGLLDTIDRIKQLKQRLTIRYRLNPLSTEDVEKYLTCRLKVAGRERPVFTTKAVSKIASFSQNIPRAINNICDLSLLAGFLRKVDQIDKEIIEEVHEDLEEIS